MNKKPLFSIFLVVLIDMLGFSLILPLLPYYATTFGAGTIETGLLIGSYALAQLIGSPLLGRLSDRFGRRPILLVSVFGTFVGFLLMGFANSLWMLFVARILDGVTGGNISVAQAYISDVTDASNRSRGLGMIGAAFGLGFIIGPVTGGFLSQWGYQMPAWFAAALSLANLALIAAWLPESLPAEKRSTENASRPAITLGALLDALRKPFTGALLTSRFVFGVAFAIFQTLFSLYALQKFKLGAIQTGYILTYVGILSVITQGYLVGKITRLFREDFLIVTCVAIMAGSMFAWGWVPSVPLLLFVMAPMSLAGGTLNTLLSSTLSKAVATTEVGGILGLSTAIESSTRVIAPVLGGWLLQQFGTAAPGIFGGVALVALAIYTYKAIYRHPLALQIATNPKTPSAVGGDSH